MKKIMFNDKYGLTQAVLEGRKTMTRRMVGKVEAESLSKFDKEPQIVFDEKHGDFMAFRDDDDIEPTILLPTYNVGDIVSIAQSYKDCGYDGEAKSGWCHDENEQHVDIHFKEEAGWTNKRFVRSELMKHHIRITGIKVERLQDISDEDCQKEGIREYGFMCYHWEKVNTLLATSFRTYIKAFAALIDKVSGKGIWNQNPWVFCYSFELID